MTPFEVLAEAKRRSAEAVIAQSGLAHEGLRRHLRELLAGDDPESTLMQEPVLEGAHPFVTTSETMDALSGRLLHPDLVRALDDLPPDHDYRFSHDRKPFLHQVESWQRLAESEPQSVLVTSGTGSGKTECFLFPILSDLSAQAASGMGALEGVQAIMLYPLNALIESQRERLSVWTRPFKGTVRYCLYNGALEDTEREANRRRSPEQVIDRERLRESPPPILVTNITMLEYMLVRSQDRSILDASRGKLKWIVLDEAHSLVGAAAAEIALLLRRTMLAFGVEPEEVRFVATSATIGSGENVRVDLQKFLADVGGIMTERVHVIEGRRQMPTRPDAGSKGTPTDIRNADPGALYETLGSDPATWRLVERLFDGGVPLRDFLRAAKSYGVSGEELVFAMARAARKNAAGQQERLAPIRVHAFERAIPGIWSCINPECSSRPADWPFGRVLTKRADDCPDCRAPVLEVTACIECGEAFLEGAEKEGRLLPPLRNPPADEFAFDSARERDRAGEGDDDFGEAAGDGGSTTTITVDRLFAVNPSAKATRFWLNSTTWRISDGGETALSLRCDEHAGMRACPHCRPEGARDDILRPIRFGAPFILGNVAPILLDGVEPARADGASRLPSQGRRLLSFTDSRQGTARLAAKLQTESERNFVRSFVYHQVQQSMRAQPGSEARRSELEHEIRELEKLYQQTRNSSLLGAISRSNQELLTLEGGSTEGIAWPQMLQRLSERVEVSSWIDEVWRSRDAELFNSPTRVAEFLLFREFARRPKRANSLETLGLARLRNAAVDTLSEALLPEPLRRRKKTIADWRAYLNSILTWFVRANGAIAISREMQHWVSVKGKRTRLLDPHLSADGEKGITAWPNGYGRANPRSRPVALLLKGLELSLDSQDRDDLAECLQSAWTQLSSLFSNDPDRRAFDFPRAFIAPVTEAFYCPVTRRILDCAPFGLTPYGIEEKTAERQRAQPVALPSHPMPALGSVDVQEARRKTQQWIADDPAIAQLRNKGAWTNLSDRIALFSDYSRSAEHSAQQENWLLRRFEQQFKTGEINILNCSTTMEMGVDIGSVSAVMMTNVPPSIANYRQRVGRAGRRGQAMSLAFTFCKDRPLDQEAFRNPSEFLNRTLAAPKVTFSSRPIVQRHVNAWLLAAFMRAQGGDALKMLIGSFFGCPAAISEERPLRPERPVQQFVEWLAQPSIRSAQEAALATIVRHSVKEGDRTLIEETKEAVGDIEKRFATEWGGLRALARDEGMVAGARSRMGIQLKRLCGEFLLSGLADLGFLPGHGFPTDVVTFLPAKIEDKAEQDGSRHRWAVGPQRSLDLAIRDYAPGSEVVLNGLVHKSAGVTLNWKRPASEEKLRDIQSLRTFWQCITCGTSGTAWAQTPDICDACGSNEIEWREFLQPAGFTVDPREKPHADTDMLSYVPPEQPAVSTGGVPWRNLPLPELGRYRCSREGLVFYSNKGGPAAFGYALCLECGRAEPDTKDDGSGRRVNPLADHKPLRFTKGAERCPGNNKPFSIKRNLWLGHEITTDVFELQPHQPLPSRAAANALVIALREALARALGVEDDEMGFAVANWRNALGGNAISLYLFDRAAGGAGFSVLLEDHIRDVIEEVARLLDCKTPGCETACAACVLVSDAPRGEDALDRTAALRFVRDHLVFPEDLRQEDRFGADARLSLAPADEIARYLQTRQQAALTLFLSAGSEPATLPDWPLARNFLEWTQRGHPVTLAFPSNVMNIWSAAEKLALRDFALHHHVGLATGEAPRFAHGATALALVGNGSGRYTVWTTRDPDAALAGPLWAVPGTHPIVRGTSELPVALVPLDLDALLPAPGAHYCEIDAELDCVSMEFGRRAATLFADALKKVGDRERKIASLSYSDSFVASPLVTGLLIDTVAALVKIAGGEPLLAIVTRPPRESERAGGPWQVGHDWREPGIQRAVIEAYGKLRGVRVSVRQTDTVPHGRFFEVRFMDGRAASIVLDQGFGAWLPVPGPKPRFDFLLPAAQQANQLAKMNVLLKRKGAGKSYIVARDLG